MTRPVGSVLLDYFNVRTARELEADPVFRVRRYAEATTSERVVLVRLWPELANAEPDDSDD